MSSLKSFLSSVDLFYFILSEPLKLGPHPKGGRFLEKTGFFRYFPECLVFGFLWNVVVFFYLPGLTENYFDLFAGFLVFCGMFGFLVFPGMLVFGVFCGMLWFFPVFYGML